MKGRPSYTTEAILLVSSPTPSSEFIGPIWCTHLHQITTVSWSRLKQTIQMDLKGHIEWKSPQGNVYRVVWDRSLTLRPKTEMAWAKL